MDDQIVTDPEMIRLLAQQLEDETGEVIPIDVHGPVELTPPDPTRRSHTAWKDANQRRLAVLHALRAGSSVKEAIASVGVQYTTYLSWRQRYPEFSAQADAAKQLALGDDDITWNGTRASFHASFFGRKLTWFQLLCINEMMTMRRGNILVVLWPPGHGKTSTFEDHASAQLAVEPSWRFMVGSESRDTAAKILGTVKGRMDPMGPTPAYVEKFGPFMPQPGNRHSTQPWGQFWFNVFKARHSDQRDYSMRAVGAGSKQTVSTRSDHFHLDDIQSTNTFTPQGTDRITSWVRQDVFSRANEEGITTVFGTRVGDDDVYERLLDDPELDASIMKVIRLPAIIVDKQTNEVRPLWPDEWTMEKLDRQRKKVGQEAWDRNYMQSPGLTSKGRGTFNKDAVEPCQNPEISLQHRAEPGAIIYVGLDPSIGGRNCVMAVEATPEQKLIIRRIQEDIDLKNNAQVIGSVAEVMEYVSAGGAHLTDLVIEAMAFQKGLMHDENLVDLRHRTGVAVTDHLTGWNKYDENIGIPSMVESFNRKEIVLPWADDDYTREMIGELKRQLYAWRPGLRGNRLRQDMVMCLWFVWIIWRGRWKTPNTGRSTGHNGFKRSALPYAPTKSGLLVPTRR